MATPPRLKIGLVFDDSLDRPDGVQQYVRSLGEWLGRQGHEVRYLAGDTRRRDIDGLYSMSKNINTMFNGNRLSIPLPARRRHIRDVLQRESFDILHVQVPYSPFMAHRVIMAVSAKTAIIGTFHIAPYSRLVSVGARLLALWTWRSRRRLIAMVSVSSAAQAFALEAYKRPTDIIPNMVDYQRFKAGAMDLPAVRSGPLKIVFLGRLVPRKGCSVLLKAVQQLQGDTDLPSYEVIIAGKGPLDASLKQFVQTNGLSDIVRFTGYVDEADKPALFASADIAVFPSSGGESFGIILLEAMASGRAAVLAGDNPGYRSVLHNKPELLFDPNDPVALAKHLRRFMKNEAKRQEAAAWGEHHAAKYDTTVVGRQLLQLYQGALHKVRLP